MGAVSQKTSVQMRFCVDNVSTDFELRPNIKDQATTRKAGSDFPWLRLPFFRCGSLSDGQTSLQVGSSPFSILWIKKQRELFAPSMVPAEPANRPADVRNHQYQPSRASGTTPPSYPALMSLSSRPILVKRIGAIFIGSPYRATLSDQV